MILAWLILNPLKFLACEALIILMVRTSFISFKLTGNKIDLGLPEPIGVTRINCLMFRFPLHVILRTFIVLLSGDTTWICCFGVFSKMRRFTFSIIFNETLFYYYIINYFQSRNFYKTLSDISCIDYQRFFIFSFFSFLTKEFIPLQCMWIIIIDGGSSNGANFCQEITSSNI